MPQSLTSRRGRKPSIATAAAQTKQVRRALKGLVSQMESLEARLIFLDRFYTRLLAEGAVRSKSDSLGGGVRGRGLNVREVAFQVLQKARKPLPIPTIAALVHKSKGGRAGQHFVQNLGAALLRDKRFKRIERGVYGIR